MKARRENEAVDNAKREKARIQREKEAETRVSTESLRSRSNSEFHILRGARAVIIHNILPAFPVDLTDRTTNCLLIWLGQSRRG